IEGEVDSSLEVDSFTFTYTTNFVEHENIFARGKEKIVHVHNGKFKVRLNESPSVFYVKFNLPKNRSENLADDYRLLGNNANVFMLQPTSIVKIKVYPNTVVFSGAQKKSMECQFQLFRLYNELNKRKNMLANAQDFSTDILLKERIWKYLDGYTALHDSIITISRKIISQYKSDLDDSVSNSIYYNFVGLVKFFEINNLNFQVDTNTDTLRYYFIDYYNQHYHDNEEVKDIENYLGQSNMYPKYLAYKARTDLSMRLAPLGRGLKPDVMLVDDLISQRFSSYV